MADELFLIALALHTFCSLQSFVIELKKTWKPGDFGHNGRTSEGMANRMLPFDFRRFLGLYTSYNGVLTVVLWPFVIPLNNA